MYPDGMWAWLLPLILIVAWFVVDARQSRR